ncbi:MAG: 50S ribosomal protein L4 [Spirochaetales bacterium]|nr:50S ribosomal protein L4 [Spirochaetales bacterium]
MKKKVFSIKGEEIRDIKLSDDVFDVEVSDGSIYYAINNEMANRRVGTACTKTRGEVNGSNVKPYAQKGTGRARAGDFKSPTRVGGGTIFGPRPRDYSYKIPKKMKRLAFRSILTMKAKDDSLKVIEDFTVESGKTKDLVSILKNHVQDERAVLILKDDDAMLKRAARNIPWLRFVSYNRLNVHDLFYAKKILVLETAAKNLNEFYGK